MQPKISVIVPVYNVEKFLARCLDSILAQTMPSAEYEIVCVNDGSTDSSPEILADYAAKHPNIRIVTKENGGLSSARNAGMDAAQGEYIWFVDSDDYLPRTEALELLYEKASELQLDILCFTLEKVYESDALAVRYANSSGGMYGNFKEEILPERALRGPEMFAFLASTKQLTPFVWLRIYRRAFLADIHLRFIEGITFEDLPFQVVSEGLAARAACWSAIFYSYFRREGSITLIANKEPASKVYSRLVAFEVLDRFEREHVISWTPAQRLAYEQYVTPFKEHCIQKFMKLSPEDQREFQGKLRRERKPELLRRLRAGVRRFRWESFKRKLRRHLPKGIRHTVKQFLDKGD